MVVMVDGCSNQEHEAEVTGSADDGTIIGISDWVIRTRQRPILSEQETEAFSRRIASYWTARGKTTTAHADQQQGITPGE
jgi:hypothetical protein